MQVTRYISTTLLSLFLLYGCNEQQTDSEKIITPVRVQTVKVINVSGDTQYSVSITPYTQINLAFKVGGYIDAILQRKGADGRMRDIQTNDVVLKDTVLARVNQADYLNQVKEAKASLAKANAALRKAEDDFRRASNLYATQSLTQREYDSARKEHSSDQAQVAGAQAQLNEAQLNVAYTELKAPRDGVLLQRNIEVGTLASPGTVGFVLADVTSVKAVFGVPEAALAVINIGDTLSIDSKSLPGITFNGIVTAIAAQADSNTRLFSVELTIANPDNVLKPGMIASLQVPEGMHETPSVLVPLAAIVRSPQNAKGYAVYVLENRNGTETAVMRDVELGDEVHGNKIVVLQGLQAGEQFIVSGVNNVHDGESIRIVP